MKNYVYRRYLSYNILVFVLFFYLSGCRNQIKNEIKQMQSQRFNIDTKQMIQTVNGKDTIIHFKKDHILKLVIFTDSTSCTSCAMKQMYHWDPFIDKAYKSNHMLQLMFVFSPKKNEIDLLNKSLKIAIYDYPIYIDTLSVFEKMNPHLPKNKALHTFLLDEHNQVILVGSPLYNKKIEEMFYKIVEEKLGKLQ